LTVRSTGAPKAQDAASTRAAILDSAVALFSERGFAATSLNDIAARAKTPKSLVLYHFKSKDSLWSTILHSKVAPFAETVKAFLDGSGGSLEGLVRTRYELMREHPEIPRLLGWVSMQPALAPRELQEVAKRLVPRLQAGDPELGVPPELDPVMFFVVLIAATDGWFRFRGLYSALTGHDFTDRKSEDDFIQTLVKTAFPKDAELCGSNQND
jgi:AcrR family transcriptional regulator